MSKVEWKEYDYKELSKRPVTPGRYLIEKKNGLISIDKWSGDESDSVGHLINRWLNSSGNEVLRFRSMSDILPPEKEPLPEKLELYIVIHQTGSSSVHSQESWARACSASDSRVFVCELKPVREI